MLRLCGRRFTIEELETHNQSIIERCERQRVTLLQEREKLRMSALLRDHEPKLRQANQQRQEIDRVVNKLLKTVPLPRQD